MEGAPITLYDKIQNLGGGDMSLKELQETMKGQPPVLEAQVVGYAKSVDDALPEIFREAGRSLDRELGDQLVFIAGLQKLHGMVF